MLASGRFAGLVCFGVLCWCVAVDCSVTVVCLGYAFVRGLPAGSVLCSAFGSNIFFFLVFYFRLDFRLDWLIGKTLQTYGYLH